jgi:competence ComEA-like helix-hairpin-helix protein
MLFGLAAFAQKKPPEKPIDINTASVEQLQQLPGVGPVIAQSIFDFRRKSGPFRRVEDLLAIRGISEARLKVIAPYVTVSPPKPAVPEKSEVAPPPEERAERADSHVRRSEVYSAHLSSVETSRLLA